MENVYYVCCESVSKKVLDQDKHIFTNFLKYLHLSLKKLNLKTKS